MKVARTTRWDVAKHGPLSEANIRLRHQPPEMFRISRYSYDAGSRFSQSTRAGVCYVLRGEVRFGETKLHAGDEVSFDDCSCEVEVAGEGRVEVVFVWELPPAPESRV